jgi:hypothetical protein
MPAKYIWDGNRRLEETFNEFCERYPEIVQEMAERGDIIDPKIIKICQKHAIKFKSDFLDEIGL